jgi:hypothetical protein
VWEPILYLPASPTVAAMVDGLPAGTHASPAGVFVAPCRAYVPRSNLAAAPCRIAASSAACRYRYLFLLGPALAALVNVIGASLS